MKELERGGACSFGMEIEFDFFVDRSAAVSSVLSRYRKESEERQGGITLHALRDDSIAHLFPFFLLPFPPPPAPPPPPPALMSSANACPVSLICVNNLDLDGNCAEHT
jgi:hypothetical protein